MKIATQIVIVLALLVSCKSGNKSGTQETGLVQTENKTTTKQQSPVLADKSDMVLFDAGEFTMGRNNGLPEEGPAHTVTVKPFYIDKYPVTVGQFRTFIKETGYITEAQKFKDSGVFDFTTNQWSLLPGTTWEFPLGPTKERAKNDHPVTHVSWRDAAAYAKWVGKRLPTEAEWEYAARDGGKSSTVYPWGNEPKVNGKWMANVFQGKVETLTVEDGFLHTSPVGAFGPTASGLYDMCGNVWQWTADTYRPYGESTMPADENTKVTRGGSFMFDEYGDAAFTVFFRSRNTIETSLFNTGFRCAADGE